MKLLIAIPCLNEAEGISGVLKALPTHLEGISSFKVLVIDDGSTDNTAEKAKISGADVIAHTHNLGVGEAFKTALEFALANGFDIMINVDGDGQFDLKDIPRLLEPIIKTEADFVSGSRFVDPSCYPEMPAVKFWGNKRISHFISKLTGERFYDVSCGFRAYSREALLKLNLEGKFTYTQETFLDLTLKNLRIKEVPIQVTYFPGRKSRVAGSIPVYAFKTLKIILRAYRDYYPIRFFWSIALVFFSFGVFFGSILLFHYIKYQKFSGHIWAGGVSGFLLLISLTFFILGIVTDMLDRIRSNQEKILYYLKKYLVK
ncbi:MAG: glycosyltransferase family 2 protein [Nitrospinota bacterium]